MLAITSSGQLVVQSVGFICGFAIVRLLPVEQYAAYTIANTCLGAMIILADCGVGAGVMAQAGRAWQDRAKLSQIIVTGMELRRRLVIFSLIVTLPVLFYLLRKHGSSVQATIFLLLAVLPAVFSTISNTLLQVPLLLNQAVSPLQQYQIEANAARLLITLATICFFPFAAIAILATGIGLTWNNFRLRNRSASYIDFTQLPCSMVRSRILKTVARVSPGTIHYSISGQLSVWLLSIYGKSEDIAAVGALGRIGALLAIFTMVFKVLVSPHFAKLPVGGKAVLRRYLVTIVFLVMVITGISVLTLLFPNPILWVLGEHYTYLEHELFLLTTATIIAVATSVANNINTSRGYVIPPIQYYVTIVSVQIYLIYSLNLADLISVIMLSLIVNSISFLAIASYGIYKIASE